MTSAAAGQNKVSSSAGVSLKQKIRKAIGVRFILSLFFVSALMVLLISVVVNIHMKRYEKMIAEATQSHLMSAAQAVANLISAEELDRYHTDDDIRNPEFRESKAQALSFAPGYRQLKVRLFSFAQENNIKYAYYLREYGENHFQYIVDNDFDSETIVTPYDILEIGNIARIALSGIVTNSALGDHDPSWENLISGFAPVYDKDENIYCIAGVDIDDTVMLEQRSYSQTMTLLQIIALSVSVLFGILNMRLYRRKAQQIEEAHGKLQYFNNNLRRAFSTYLSEDVVEEIVADPTRLKLGGIKRHMTAIFTDIKDFSGLAEGLDPAHLVDLLNHYLSSMSDIILEQKGTIDKYEGDAIISFFGAPLELTDHALRACLAAIAMKRMEKDVNAHIIEKGISPAPLFTRIGINSGDMVVGNMGTQKKMNYTIISNAVNMASRLEGINKQYGSWILASENTVKETGNQLLTRRLDRIRVVGINESVRIYEILDTMADAPEALQERILRFHDALTLFEARAWKDAEAAFAMILRTAPDDGPSRLYHQRCRQFQENPPESTWDGVFTFDQK